MHAQVDIIVLNWNEREETIQCLQQLVSLQYPEYRIVVVDNGSSDGSLDAFRSFSLAQGVCFRHLHVRDLERQARTIPKPCGGRGCLEIVVIENGENLGFAAGVNSGLLFSLLERQAQYVLLLNNDVCVSPEFLLPLVEVAETHPNVGIVGGKILYQDRKNTIWYAGGRISLLRGCGYVSFAHGRIDDGTWDQEAPTGFVTGCMMLIRLNVLESVGLLDPRFFFGGEDADFCLRAKKRGFQIYYTPRCVIHHRSSAYQYDDGALFRITHGYAAKIILWFKHVPTYMRWPLLLAYVTYGAIIAPYRQAWLAGKHGASISPARFRSAFYEALKRAFTSGHSVGPQL